MQPKSWKTTAWGVTAGVFTLVGFALKYHSTGQFPTAEEFLTALGVLAAALGLKAAADNSELKK